MPNCREILPRRGLSRLDSVGPPRAILLLFALAAGLSLSACGSGGDADLLPGSTASEISSNLDRVRALANEAECGGAEEAVQQVSEQVEALNGVDARLQEALREGTARLAQLVAECEEAPEEETSPAIEPAVEPEEEEEKEKPEKAAKEKEKADEEADEADEEKASPELPPQAEGKAKGHEEEAAPVETEEDTASGGVGPAAPVEGE
jgi:hypothetical protein